MRRLPSYSGLGWMICLRITCSMTHTTHIQHTHIQHTHIHHTHMLAHYNTHTCVHTRVVCVALRVVCALLHVMRHTCSMCRIACSVCITTRVVCVALRVVCALLHVMRKQNAIVVDYGSRLYISRSTTIYYILLLYMSHI